MVLPFMGLGRCHSNSVTHQLIAADSAASSLLSVAGDLPSFKRGDEYSRISFPLRSFIILPAKNVRTVFTLSRIVS